MSLALLTLGLFCAPPAQAQQYPGGGGSGGGYPGGPGWTVTDQNGNPISPNQDGSGYPLCGTLTGSAPTLTGAYPDVFDDASGPYPPINYAFIPNLWSGQYWLYTGDPCPMSASVWTMASAANNVSTRGGGVLGYLPDYNSESVVGSITPTTGGTLWAIFTGQGQSVPDHIDLLLTTTVQASASVNPAPSQFLSATATATDSLNETAQASADGSGGGVPLVTGRHLLRVAVDPQTQQAQVSLGGTATATATDNVPYGSLITTIQPTDATASASISAAAKFDSREMTISRVGARQVGKVDGPNGQVYGEWVDPDGTGHGDTTFSYWTFTYVGKSLVVSHNINWQMFNANYMGAWPTWASITQTYLDDAYWGDPADPLANDGSDQDRRTARDRTQNAPACDLVLDAQYAR